MEQRMSREKLKKISQASIWSALILQFIALIIGTPYGFWSLAAACLLGTGIYGYMKSGSQQPLRSSWFYILTVISILLPLIGPIAAVQKLSTITARHEKTDYKKKTRASLIAAGLFAVLALVLGVLSWPSMSYYYKSNTVREHVALARQHIDLALSLADEEGDIREAVAAAEAELSAAKELAFSFRYDSLNNVIALYAGDIHLLKREWGDAEREYRASLAAGGSKEMIGERLEDLNKERKLRERSGSAARDSRL
jgi:hypothetical protein